MSWSVRVREVCLLRAECGEGIAPAHWRRGVVQDPPEPCDWVGTLTANEALAEQERLAHYRDHDQAYAAYNASLDAANGETGTT